jgi:allantoate deiminase
MAQTKAQRTERADALTDGETRPDGDGLRPNPSRLSATFERLAEIGAEADNGVSRLPYSPEERRAHELVATWMREMGMDVRVDSVGNTIGTRRGRRPELPAIGLGSHVDTVPHGGRFDGAVGVLGALEAVRMFEEGGIQTEHPLWVVAFASEEGARFGEACLGSKAVTGLLELPDLDRLRDASGCSLRAAMQQVDLNPDALGSVRWKRGLLAAFLELHIEQARVLEAEGKKIGLVDAVAGNTRVRFEFKGRADHSGGTPMQYRKDALAAAAEVVLAAESMANDPRRRATVATVGRLDVHPNSITTVPGRVVFYLDVRDVDSDRQRETAHALVTLAQQVAARRGLELDYALVGDSSPAVLPMWLRELTTDVARSLHLPHRVLSSGAGHDAAILSRLFPAGMVFVPSHEGISHAPQEWTSIDDICDGVRVLANSVLKVDRFLAEQVGS